jgi:Spy/CpxP family protein refolding chaperone
MFDVYDVDELPDLLQVFKRRRPAMGYCPLGVSARSDTPPPREHLLHLGTTDFYLDYRRRLGLTDTQVADLRGIRDRSLAAGAALEQEIEEAEARLWEISGSDSEQVPLNQQVREIEQLRAEQRWLYLDAVVRAADVLTPAQRTTLVPAR